MEIFSETEIKYLSGLLDADGSLSFNFSGRGLYLEMKLSAAESIDRNGYVKTLSDRLGYYSYREFENENHSSAHCWGVSSRRDLGLLIPRLVKHMVIKGAHWKRLFDVYTELKGADVRDIRDELKEFSVESRSHAGPVKAKNHPTWAWVAGYLDGDGSYIHKKYGKRHTVRTCATAHIDDVVGLELLHKAFGGQIKYRDDRPDIAEWVRALGKGSTDFAVPFLKKMHKHTKLKKHRIEQILNFHSTRND